MGLGYSTIKGVLPASFLEYNVPSTVTRTLNTTQYATSPSCYATAESMSGDPLASRRVTVWDLVWPPLALMLIWGLAGWRWYINKHHDDAPSSDAFLAPDRLPHIWAAWETPSWLTLYGLAELHITGALPWAPWPASTLWAWEDKFYLKRLCRGGILPLAIQTGAFETRLYPADTSTTRSSRRRSRKKSTVGKWLDRWLPLYVQFKRRGYIDFVMPFPPVTTRDRPRNLFLQVLYEEGLEAGYAVTSWLTYANGPGNYVDPAPEHQALERGTTSRFPVLLPFKKDKVIRYGTGGNLKLSDYFINENCPLLSKGLYALVRVEARQVEDVRLDAFVADVAYKAGLCNKFSEPEIKAVTRKWLIENELGDLLGIQKFMWKEWNGPKESDPWRTVEGRGARVRKEHGLHRLEKDFQKAGRTIHEVRNNIDEREARLLQTPRSN